MLGKGWVDGSEDPSPQAWSQETGLPAPSTHLPAGVSSRPPLRPAPPSPRPLRGLQAPPHPPPTLLSGVCSFLQPPSLCREPPGEPSKSIACLPESRGPPGRPFPRGRAPLCAPPRPRPGRRPPRCTSPAPHGHSRDPSCPSPAAVPLKPWTRGLWGGSTGPHRLPGGPASVPPPRALFPHRLRGE